jgi:hypothetical protein
VLSTNAQNTASLLPYQLQAAQHAGDTWTGIGSLLSAAGGVAGSLSALAPSVAGTAAASGGTSLINDAPSFGGSFLKGIPVLPIATSPFV